MLRAFLNFQSHQNPNQMVLKEARIRQLPSTRRWIVSPRISMVMTSFVLVSWIAMSLINNYLFLREVLASSFIIGCSFLFNKSNFVRDALDK